MRKRNINLKGFLSSLLVVFWFGVGSFLLLGKWEQQPVLEHVRDLMYAWFCVVF